MLSLVSSDAPDFELSSVPIPRHLARFIDSWLGYREVSAQAVERMEHPSGRAVLIFEFGDPIELRESCGASARFRTGFFAGIGDTPTLTSFSGKQAGIEVNLSPEGTFALAQGALGEFKGRAVETVDLRIDASLGPKLREAKSWEARFQIVENALWTRFASARALSPLVRRAIDLIDTRHGSLRIKSLSEALRASRGYVHERFMVETGFSPKRYAALRRFSRIKSMAESLARVALAAGYADHAHLSREVRKFAGTTPAGLTRDLKKPIALEVSQLLSADGASFPGRE